jgi:hypothetical protein
MPPWLKIIMWWELRRPLFNIGVGTLGLMCMFNGVFFADDAAHLCGINEGGEPFGLLVGAILYGLVVNAIYTAGWIFHLSPERQDVDAALEEASQRIDRWFIFACTPPVGILMLLFLLWLATRVAHALGLV